MISFTPAEIAALESVLDQARADFEHYTRAGKIDTDFPGEVLADWLASRRAEYALVAAIIERAEPRK